MCGHCGCEALEVIAELTAEHDVVVALGGEAARCVLAGDIDAAAEKARAITAVLGPHTVVEERALFPVMAEDFGDHVQGLVDEHRLIEAVLAEARDGTPTDPDWPDRLVRALRTLREHILKEQDGLFPAALAYLDGTAWEEVEAVRATVGSHLRADV